MKKHKHAIFLLILIVSIFSSNFPAANNARAWTEPVEIDGDLYLGAPRVVAVGETLHVIAVDPPRAWYIYSRDNGQTWSEPVMPIDTSRLIEQPDLRYSNGYLHLVWMERTFYPQLYHSRSSDGGRSWAVPMHVLNNNASRVLSFPTLAANGDTLFVACATENEYPFLRSFNGGVTWQDSTNIDWGNFMIVQYPRLRYSAGVLHFIYPMLISGDSLGHEVYYSKSTDLGLTWSERIVLSPAEPYPQTIASQLPFATADSAGKVLVTWMDYANGSMCGISGDIFYRVSLDNGETWGPVGSITNTQSGEDSYSLILGDEFHVVWTDNWLLGCGYPKQAYSTSADSGGSWRPREFISGSHVASETTPVLVFTFDQADTIMHCFFTREEAGSHLCYFRNRDFVAVNEPGPPLADGISLVAYPNPFNSQTVLTLTNFRGGDAEIVIYDIAGRLVRTFKGIGIKGGDAKIVWGATDTSGKTVSSGLYIAVASSRTRTAHAKLLYLK